MRTPLLASSLGERIREPLTVAKNKGHPQGASLFFWRRKRDSNPRGFWPNGFQDRLVVTASIFLRVNSFTRRGYRCGSEIYFRIRFATFAKGEIFLRANEKVIKLNILDIVLDVPVFAIFGLTKKSMFSRLLEVLSSDRPINFQDRLDVSASHNTRSRVKLACKRQV